MSNSKTIGYVGVVPSSARLHTQPGAVGFFAMLLAAVGGVVASLAGGGGGLIAIAYVAVAVALTVGVVREIAVSDRS